jgi:hypothetical protein
MLCVQPRPPESLRLLAAAVAGPAGVVAVRLDAVPVAAVARGREVAETAVLSLGEEPSGRRAICSQLKADEGARGALVVSTALAIDLLR